MKIRNALPALLLSLALTLGGCSLSGAGDAALVSSGSSVQESTRETGSSSAIVSEESAEPEASGTEESGEETSSAESETSSEAEESSSEVTGLTLTVRPGEYWIEILPDLSALLEIPEAELLETAETMDRGTAVDWQTGETEHRAFQLEGYIAPGEYGIPEGSSGEEALKILLAGWEKLIPEGMAEEASKQGLTLDEVLIMASIVEYESSHDTSGEVKPFVAAVVRNRIDYPMALEIDVTIFYLQEALGDYREKADYEAWYNTYETASLPAGPINSPSLESLEAVLHPADTNDLFFIYDREGNYYFAEDYDTHLQNCERYLD